MARVQDSAATKLEERDDRLQEQQEQSRGDASPRVETRDRTEKPADEVDHDDDAKDEKKPPLRDRLRQHWMLTTIGVIVLLVAVAFAIVYWLNARHYETTDDAFVDARSFSVAGKVGGYVTDVLV